QLAPPPAGYAAVPSGWWLPRRSPSPVADPGWSGGPDRSRYQRVPSRRRQGDSPTLTGRRRRGRHARARAATPPARATRPPHPSRRTGVALGSTLHASHSLAHLWQGPDGGSGPRGLRAHDGGYAARHRAAGTPAWYPRAGPGRGGGPAGEKSDRI